MHSSRTADMLSIPPPWRCLLFALGVLALWRGSAVLQAEDNPFAEQLAAIRSLATVRASWIDSDVGNTGTWRSRDRFLAKGRYWKLQSATLADDTQQEVPDTGYALCEAPTGRAYLYCPEAVLIVARYASGMAGITTSHLHFGRAVDRIPLIDMFAFLSYEQGIPDGSLLQWNDFWDDALIHERLHQLVQKQQDDSHGGTWVTILLHPPAAPGDHKHDGSHLDIHVESVPELRGARVITEVRSFWNGVDLAPVNWTTFTYRLVCCSSDGKTIPLLAESARFASGSPDSPYETRKVTAIDCIGEVADAELEIDARSAKTVRDVSAVLVAPPPADIHKF